MIEKLFGAVSHTDTVHFIGIGGIGMSGLAEVLARSGFSVQGSDLATPYTAEKLTEAGVNVFLGHAAAQVQKAKLVVVSSAIKANNVELVAAEAAGLKVVHRAALLAEIMRPFNTVAVSGTHGKTSTTALIYTALKAAGVPVGVINGGIMNDLGTNAVLPPAKALGKSWLVVEADESDASFLTLKPTVAVVTNIEPEHMETYGSEEKLLQAFVDFMTSADEVVVCADDPDALIAAARLENKDIVSYGLTDDADVYATTYAPQGTQMAFDAVLRGGTLPDVVVNQPGVHSVQNSLAALAVAQLLKVDVTAAAGGLADFTGVGRRFSRLGRLPADLGGAEVIDDYGHHPTEIAATLEAAKGMYRGRVAAVIQPHRFTRLRDLMDDFATSAKVADAIIYLPVYAAGEAPLPGITHTVLAEKTRTQLAALGQPVVAVADEAELRAALAALHLQPNDAVLCLGAGSISQMAKNLIAQPQQKAAGK